MDAVDLFYSYAHEDEVLRDELARQLRVLERKGVLRSWHDRRIDAGQDWDRQIDQHLRTADLILLLVSADFLDSDYIWGRELEVALQRSERGEASVVPVLVRDCLMEDAPFAKLQGLPTDLKPVTSWPNRDEAWTNVARGIRRIAIEMQARGAAVPPPAPALPIPPLPGPVAPPQGPDPTPDPLIDGLVDDFNAELASASQARGALLDRESSSRSARALIDEPRQSRVLWVDDRPEGNRRESAALRKLQIEVVAVTSTAEALARVAGDEEPFDLVLSDWARPAEPAPDGLAAGLWLLRELRRRGNRLPLVFYHGTFEPAARAQLRLQALREGAFGEAVQPDELLQLVCAALTAA